MKVALASGQASPAQGGACAPPDEPNTSCGDLSIDVSVRGGPSQANDIIDIEGWSVPVKGRVHDCASDGKLLLVATASQIVLVNVTLQKSKEIVKYGADRVAMGAGWAAWANRAELQARAVDTL